MKLLIPNAKELNTNQDAFSYQELSQKPQAILDILTDFSVEDLTNFYKINSSKADQEWLRWQRLSEKDAKILVSSKYLSNLFEEAGRISGNYKAVSNWIISDISRILNEKEMEPNQIPFEAKHLANLVNLIDKGTISSKIAKDVLEEMFENPREPEEIIKEKGWVQISDEGEIKKIVQEILEANPQSIADYKAGKDRALGFLVGQAMKATKGKANPQMLNKMFIEEMK